MIIQNQAQYLLIKVSSGLWEKNLQLFFNISGSAPMLTDLAFELSILALTTQSFTEDVEVDQYRPQPSDQE